MNKWKTRFDHAAIATKDPQKLKKVLMLLGLRETGLEPVPSQGVNTHFIEAENGKTQIEILESVDPQGVIARYLDKKGSGIHHLSFMVEGLDALSEELRKNSIRLIYDAAKPGAHHTRVNFIHPESTGGILIEISEKE